MEPIRVSQAVNSLMVMPDNARDLVIVVDLSQNLLANL